MHNSVDTPRTTLGEDRSEIENGGVCDGVGMRQDEPQLEREWDTTSVDPDNAGTPHWAAAVADDLDDAAPGRKLVAVRGSFVESGRQAVGHDGVVVD